MGITAYYSHPVWLNVKERKQIVQLEFRLKVEGKAKSIGDDSNYNEWYISSYDARRTGMCGRHRTGSLRSKAKQFWWGIRQRYSAHVYHTYLPKSGINDCASV